MVDVERYAKRIRVPTIPAELIRDAERAMMREQALALVEEKSRTHPVAFTGVMHEGMYVIGLAEQDVAGYTPLLLKSQAGPMGMFPTYDAASKYAEDMNAELGISKEQAIRIVLSTMRAERVGGFPRTVGELLQRKTARELRESKG